ncbi:two-component regulator propeller domain-containing protein [Aestuariibaculum marinum]|uniref:histidine kinase n=1 Tax=Aestuariibaculum marinum TaxID=2683592 RepID=A0A8J6UD10_9FLAO|nr:two-component regulator propeller domain-containing protein [Aestuariibaculum marinum]MBD0825403.1 helix-turn-helix domain-containing protein [Aestuariibaculum marinum]
MHSNLNLKSKSFLIFLTIFLLLSSIVTSQENQFRFHTFSPEGGFYYDGIAQIKQDQNGFIWILMENDLYRFDGYNYKRYYNHFKDSEDLFEKNFRSIVVDNLGQLYVSLSSGLYTYNKLTDSFTKVLEGDFFQLWVTRNNIILAIKSNHFGKYDPLTKRFVEFSFNGKPLSNVQNVINENKGFFFISWGRNIFRYNNETDEISSFYTFKNDNFIKGSCKIHNTLWLLSAKNSFYKMDIPSGNIINEEEIQPLNESIFPKMILADKNEKIWIASQKGLFVYNTKNKTCKNYIHDKTDPFSLPNNSIWTIEEDLQKNIWIGTYSGGLCYVNLDKKNHFTSFSTSNSPLNQNLVSGFAEDDNSLWIATEGGGINQIDKRTSTYNYYLNSNENYTISSNNVKSLLIDQNKNLWFATFRGGLGYYNQKNKKFKHFEHDTRDNNSILVNNLRKLLLDSKNNLWIIYQNKNLEISKYSINNDIFHHYQIDDEEPYHYIYDICENGNNQLWILTHNNLYSFDKDSGKTKKIELPNNSLLYGQTFCLDGNENLWIGTIGKGLYRYNTKTNTFKNFDEILKFGVSSIYSISLDFENNIWLGTDNGLFKYNTSTNSLFRFDKKDGVQGQVFYPLSTFVDKSGKLLFGGTKGFTIVNPRNIDQNIIKPKAIISNFYIDNTPSNPTTKNKSINQNSISFPKSIELNYKQSNFGFTFSSNNYLVPEKNRFKYRLKKYDNRWIEVDAFNRNAFYSKVPSGNYTFEVIVANNDGIWGDPLRISINKLPAPWLSWWAYTIYFLIICSVIFTIFKYYRFQKKLKLQLYLDKLNQEKQEEIHQSQLRLFTNISHDFRTPLSLISASIEKLRNEGLKEYYYRILNGNTKRLLGLINELMDFKAIENGKLPLQVTKANINEQIETFAFGFKDYAHQHDIYFNIELDPNLSSLLFIDKHILEKIVMNLLNNSFKFTNKGGQVTIKTISNKSKFHSSYQNKFNLGEMNLLNNCYCISINDTGIGISQENLPKIFERFYTANSEGFNTIFGTGIGLFLVKSLILLHKAELIVYSEENKGTDFLICFPTDPKIYKDSEFLNNPEDSNRKEPTIANKSYDIQKSSEEIISQENNYVKDKRRILLAEDNEDLRNMISDYLSINFEIIEAENGLVALNLLKKMRIDLIISDIMMPEKDGIAFCKEVKEDINYSHIPFLLLTAKVSIDSKLEGADSGADIYFEKPIDFKLLLLSVKNVFKQQMQMREYYSKNFFAQSHELTTNERESEFMRTFISILDKNLDKPQMDVNHIANEVSMSRSKLYNKIKSITGNSIIEFIKNYRLRKAAHLIIETDLSMREIMTSVGIESQSYFSRSFKKEFGITPSQFAIKNKKNDL